MWIWDIYMPYIIPQPLATDPLHGRAKIAAIYVKDSRCLLMTTTTYRLVRKGPAALPAPAQERRAPTIGAALLPTGSGPALTRLLSYDAVAVGLEQTRSCRGATTEGVPARKSMSVAHQRE